MAEKEKRGKLYHNTNGISSQKQNSCSPVEDVHKERKKIRLSSAEVRDMNRDKLVTRWKEQDAYIDTLLTKLEAADTEEIIKLKDSESKLQLQIQESTRRENVLNMRLATKQQEMQDLLSQVHDLKQAQSPENSQLNSMMIDPAVNLLFKRMKAELTDAKDKLEQAQNDLSAWKFTPDSVTGKKLMAKCRNLLQENQELGKQISQGRVAQLEAEISLQKKYTQEVKSALDELSEFVIQLDEEVEAMQSTILHLQQQLKESREALTKAGISKDRTSKQPSGPVDTSTHTNKVTSKAQD
ncbi:hypothetical protein EMCRGX_G034997 [Ephydatia muelleri]